MRRRSAPARLGRRRLWSGQAGRCVGLRLVERLRPHQRLGERVETIPVLGEEPDRLVVRLADDPLDLRVDALARVLRDLGQPLQRRRFAVLRQNRDEADLLAHPEAADHQAGELCRLPDVGLGAGRLVAVTNPLGDSVEVFLSREDAERFIEEVRGDDPELAS